jgi:hypothetical protein
MKWGDDLIWQGFLLKVACTPRQMRHTGPYPQLYSKALELWNVQFNAKPNTSIYKLVMVSAVLQ